MQHLEMRRRLAYGAKAEPLIEPPRWVSMEYLKTHGDTPFGGLA